MKMLVQMTDDDLSALLDERIEAKLAALDADRLLTPEEVAEKLGISPRNIANLVSRDQMPAHRVGPRLLRFRWVDVERWARERGRNLPETPKPRHLRSLGR